MKVQTLLLTLMLLLSGCLGMADEDVEKIDENAGRLLTLQQATLLALSSLTLMKAVHSPMGTCS